MPYAIHHFVYFSHTLFGAERGSIRLKKKAVGDNTNGSKRTKAWRYSSAETEAD